MPNAGLTGTFAEATSSFSLLSSGSLDRTTTAGEAGIVLNRFFSGAVVLRKFDEDRGREVLEVIVGVAREAGVVGVFLAPVGLVREERGVVDVIVVVLFAVLATEGLAIDVRSVAEVGANDILLGFADMPSFFDSSTEPTEDCF